MNSNTKAAFIGMITFLVLAIVWSLAPGVQAQGYSGGKDKTEAILQQIADDIANINTYTISTNAASLDLVDLMGDLIEAVTP